MYSGFATKLIDGLSHIRKIEICYKGEEVHAYGGQRVIQPEAVACLSRAVIAGQTTSCTVEEDLGTLKVSKDISG